MTIKLNLTKQQVRIIGAIAILVSLLIMVIESTYFAHGFNWNSHPMSEGERIWDDIYGMLFLYGTLLMFCTCLTFEFKRVERYFLVTTCVKGVNGLGTVELKEGGYFTSKVKEQLRKSVAETCREKYNMKDIVEVDINLTSIQELTKEDYEDFNS